MKVRLAVVVGLAALAAALPAGSAHARARVSIAPNQHVLQPEFFPDNVRLLRDIGPHSVKLAIPWKAVQPCRPGSGCPQRYDWSYVDTRIRWLANSGLKADLLISHAPEWATNQRCSVDGACYPRRSHYDDWRKVVQRAVNRYGPGGSFWDAGGYSPRYDVRTWESWHEPNVPHFWEERPNPAQYARVFRSFSQAVRAAHPRARVMLGSFTFSDHPTVAYVRRLFRDFRLEGTYDSVAVHPYAPTATGVLQRIREFHRITRADSVWVDEIGWNTATHDPNRFTVTPAGQAQRFRALIDGVRARLPYVKQISAFSLLDLDSNGPSAASASTYGLAYDRSRGFAPKPAYHIIKARTP